MPTDLPRPVERSRTSIQLAAALLRDGVLKARVWIAQLNGRT